MKVSRLLALACVAAASVITVSCSDQTSPTGPAARAASGAPQADLLGSLGNTLNGLLLQCSPLPTYHASKVIGRAGGTLVVGPHTFTVPPYALDHDVLITADAPSGTYNRVLFQPEGLQFDRSASLTLSYANCQGVGMLLPKHIAYTNNLLQILYFIESLDNLGANKVTGRVDHFSEYVVAW